jgi:phosphate transport system substrate-binding protein
MTTSSDHLTVRLVKHLAACCLLLVYATTPNATEITKLPTQVEGHLDMTGSVALSNLMTYWTEAFSERNPLVTVTIADPGETAGIEALVNGIANIALTSIPISPKQEESFTARFGYPPQLVPVALDAVAVYVNSLNPLTSIALQDLDAIYSSTFRCGEPQPIQTWGALGVTGALTERRITVYGLTSNFGANNLFRESALCGGDFNNKFQALAGPEALESALSSDTAGIGFSSSAMRSSGLHALAVARHHGTLAVLPIPDAIRSGRYPMSRTLGIAINQPIGQTPSPVLQAFVAFILSPEGQSIATKAGYVSLP